MKRALVVGKEKLINEVNAILPLANYQLAAKNENGIEALRMVQRVEPHLALCGWDISGLSALDLVQNLVHSRICPVILILDEKDYMHIDFALKTNLHHILMAPLRAADVVSGIIQAEYRYQKETEAAKENSKLKEELKMRKIVYQAVLQLIAEGLSEEAAYTAIRSEAMASRKTIRTVAEDVVKGKWRPG
jgi:response regulator NasT